MPKFTILAETTISYSAEIEANSRDEAYEIGKELPFSEFSCNGEDFYVYDVDEIE